MKARFFIIIFALVSSFMQTAQAQNKIFSKSIAPFVIQMVNGKVYTYKELKKNTPVVLIYFSPTCDHCQELAKAMLKNYKQIKNKQIVMIAYEPLNDVKKFDAAYGLSAYSNIKIGSEGYGLAVQKYYNVQHYPFVALYNKQQQLLKILSYELVPEKMAAAL